MIYYRVKIHFLAFSLVLLVTGCSLRPEGISESHEYLDGKLESYGHKIEFQKSVLLSRPQDYLMLADISNSDFDIKMYTDKNDFSCIINSLGEDKKILEKLISKNKVLNVSPPIRVKAYFIIGQDFDIKSDIKSDAGATYYFIGKGCSSSRDEIIRRFSSSIMTIYHETAHILYNKLYKSRLAKEKMATKTELCYLLGSYAIPYYIFNSFLYNSSVNDIMKKTGISKIMNSNYYYSIKASLIVQRDLWIFMDRVKKINKIKNRKKILEFCSK